MASNEYVKTKKFRDCASFQEGYVNPSQLKRDNFGHDIKWLRAVDLNDSFVTDTSRCLSLKGYESAGKSALLFEPGTLAISKSGTIGRLGILTDYMCGNRAVINIRVKKEVCDTFFIFYILRQLRSRITELAEGSVQKNLYISVLGNIEIPVPSLCEQREIGRTLIALDTRITSLRQSSEVLEALTKAIFKSWLVDFDPVRSKAEGREPDGMDAVTAALFPSEFQDSPLGQIPSGWEVAPLYGIAEFSNGAAYKDIHFSSNNEGLPVIKIAELKAGVTESTKFTTTYLAERFRIEQEEILFSWSGNPDTSIDTFIWDGGPAWLNQHIFRVRENGYVPRSWVYIQLKTLRSVFAEIARDKQTTGLGHVTVADMKRLLVCKPTDEIVLRFDEIAKPILARIAANQLAIRTLADLRDTLLPRLISGKLRVPEAEAMLMEVV
jgi:type I restriction enzyme S subunit